ncbi:hypothetical protein AB4Y90_05150 [Chryseobacterium sp. 2TAF14]|uniref:hypothetical protein n=1 Tax=Chryseobacterium sp. 2TAF14 TaxID=3233007 RepID=UPI003F8DFE8C
MKLSGLCIDFLVVFFIFFFVHLFSPKANYISNEDAIYGLEFNKTMQQLGFENGDKIISINNKPVKNTDKIGIDILMNSGSEIKIMRQNSYKVLRINDNDIAKILHSEGTPVKVRLKPNIDGEKIQQIKHTEEKFSFTSVLESYKTNIKGAYNFIIPEKDYKKIRGINITTDIFKGKILVLAFCSTIIGLLNLLPLPGFSLGNFIIAVVELRRNKRFNPKKKNIIGLCTVCFVVILILSQHF